MLFVMLVSLLGMSFNSCSDKNDPGRSGDEKVQVRFIAKPVIDGTVDAKMMEGLMQYLPTGSATPLRLTSGASVSLHLPRFSRPFPTVTTSIGSLPLSISCSDASRL